MASLRPTATPQLSRRTKTLLIVGAVALVVLLGGARLVDVYVDWAWFGEVGFRGVLHDHPVDPGAAVRRRRRAHGRPARPQPGDRLPGARPVFVPGRRPAEDPLARYRTVAPERPRGFGLGIPAVVALIAGLSAQAEWQTVLLFLNSTPFGGRTRSSATTSGSTSSSCRSGGTC